MKIDIPKRVTDPAAAIAWIAELRERVTILHQLAGPDLRLLMDSHDFPFSTMNAVRKFGERLMKGIAILKETVAKLQELAVGNGSAGTQPVCHNKNLNPDQE
jgi:hypothetical protein